MFQTNTVEKVKTRIFIVNKFFGESCRLWDNTEKYCRAGQATYDNIIRRMSFECRMTEARIQTHVQNIWHILLLHGNRGYANALHCCVIRILSVLLTFVLGHTTFTWP